MSDLDNRTNDQWNPRYLRYCEAHGKDPESMLVHDDERWPGGVMTGYILWIQSKWSEWHHMHNHFSDWPVSEQEHKDFDAWLREIGGHDGT